jgi:hypothetical protein
MVLAPFLYRRLGPSATVRAQQDSPPKTTATTVETYEHLWDNPSYGPGGRVPLFTIFPLVGSAGIVDLSLDGVHLAVLLAIACLFYAALGQQRHVAPRVLWCLLGASVLMYALAWGGIALTNSFLVYLPSRYTRVGLFLTLLLYVLLNARAALASISRFMRRHRSQLPWAVGMVGIGTVGLLALAPSGQTEVVGVNLKWVLGLASLAFGLLAILYVKRPLPARTNERTQPASAKQRIWVRRIVGAPLLLALVALWLVYAQMLNFFLDPSASERSLYRFLGTLPKDVLLAGTPCALDNVPLFAKRQVHFSCENISASIATVRQSLLAYYSNDPAEVTAFCRLYGIDYLVVDEATYTPDYIGEGRLFFEPWNAELVPIVANRASFALTEVSKADRLFQAESLYVVACDALGERQD